MLEVESHAIVTVVFPKQLVFVPGRQRKGESSSSDPAVSCRSRKPSTKTLDGSHFIVAMVILDPGPQVHVRVVATLKLRER